MKVIGIFAASALLVASAATAQEEMTEQEACVIHGQTAQLLMEQRQAGLPMSQIMAMTESKFMQKIIIDAYNVPKYSTQQMKRGGRGNSDRLLRWIA